jgi:broad specificity phosphatase PhoE
MPLTTKPLPWGCQRRASPLSATRVTHDLPGCPPRQPGRDEPRRGCCQMRFPPVDGDRTASHPMRLLLIRHAETPSNVAGVIDTRVPGPRLTALGDKQAHDLIAVLKHERIDTIVVSTQVRTALTAAPLASKLLLTPVVADGLREITAGSLEMKGDRRSVGTYLSTLATWVGGALTVRVPGGESGHEFMQRCDAVLSDIFETGCRVAAVISHGAAIRTWASSRARNAGRADLSHDLDNTEVVVVNGSPGDWMLNRQTRDDGVSDIRART